MLPELMHGLRQVTPEPCGFGLGEGPTTRQHAPVMPFRICKSFEIESGHLLTKHPEKCRFPHGHSRRIDVVLVADQLDPNDMVCDFKALKAALVGFLDHWDHALCLNTDDPRFAQLHALYGERIVPFDHIDPTTEVLARALYLQTRSELQRLSVQTAALYPVRPDIRVERVRVTETSSSWAEYFE